MAEPIPYAVLLCSDLFFASRVTGTADAQGVSLKTARSPQHAAELAASPACRGLLIDVREPGLDHELFAGCDCPIHAFGPHVRTEKLRSARAAGWKASTNSMFMAALDQIIEAMFAE